MKKIFLLFLTSAFGGSWLTVFSQNVGIGTATPHASAQLEINSINKGLLPPRMDSTQRNAISSPANGLVIYNTSIKGLECWNGTKWYSTVHYIGESYGGGIVFYVYDGGQHGLIAATTTQGVGVYLANNLQETYTKSDGIGAGLKNTAIIISCMYTLNVYGSTTAATVCSQYSVMQDGILYGGWYLPSKYELNLLYLQKDLVGGFSGLGFHWSSTEYDYIFGWTQSFGDGTTELKLKSNSSAISARAIRSF